MVWCTAQQGPQQDLSWYLLGYNWGKKRNDRRYLTISFKSRRHWKQSFLSIFKIVESATLCIWDENNFKPHPQNRILVALRGSFSNCRQAPIHFTLEYPPLAWAKPGQAISISFVLSWLLNVLVLFLHIVTHLWWHSAKRSQVSGRIFLS